MTDLRLVIRDVIDGADPDYWDPDWLTEELARSISRLVRDTDGTATAAANGDLPVPKDCQAGADRHRPKDAA